MHKKIVVLTILSLQAIAQHNKVNPTVNLPSYDSKRFHFGFLLALNHATFTTKPTHYFYQRYDTLKRVEPLGTLGFTVGPLVNMRLNDHFNLRAVIQFNLYQRGLVYTFVEKDGTYVQDKQTIEASFIEIPVLVKYKSIRRGNFGMYVLTGVKTGISTSNKNKDQRPDKLRQGSFDCAAEYGFGCDIYFPLFKLSPELRFSNGLINMKAPDTNIYASSVSGLKSRTLTFMLNFE